MNASQVQKIVDYLTNDLGGDWFLTGGALVQLIFNPARGTEDVDFVRISHPQLSDEASRNQLYQWLMSNGLGPEWVNPAVEPFVREVGSWQQELVPLQQGARGRVFRPNLTLFVYLKLRRGTSIDLADIREAAGKCPEGFSPGKFDSWSSSYPTTRERYEKVAEFLLPRAVPSHDSSP
jgi:hypothetical protein